MRGLSLAALLVLVAVAAAAEDLAPRPFEPAIVEVRVNGEATPVTLIVRHDTDGTLLIRQEDLAALRIKTPTRGVVIVDGERHVRMGRDIDAHVQFDAATQTADITLPPAAFVATRTSALSPDAPVVTPAGFGGFANYDLVGDQVAGRTSLGAVLDLGVFGSSGVFTTGLVGRSDDEMNGTVRLDSTWTRDFPDRLATLRVGDSISAAGAWGRSARFGGIQFGTNFSTQPTLVTTPLLNATGEAIVPSTVDVFVNGRRVATEDVPPGPFTIDRLPPITGAGLMQVVVTDALGRQQVVAQPYYSGRALLREGLNEYSFEAGSIREDYGLRSNSYGDMVVAGTFRRGFTNAFTGEVHAEGQSGGAAALGADAAWQLGNVGIVSLTAAAGGDGDVGFLGGAGFERNGQRFNVFLRTAYATESFAQLGTESLENKPKLRSFAGMGLDLDRYGSLQLSYGHQSNWGTQSNQTVALSHSVQIGAYGYLYAVASHSTSEASATDLFVGWTLPLGERSTASIALSQSPDAADGSDFKAVATYQRSLPAGSGTGYFVSLASNEDAQLDYAVQGRTGLVAVQYARNNGLDGWRVNGSGALAFTSAGVMPSRRLDQSFAVVEVADYPDMTVFVENQPVGRTDEKGRVLLDSLRAYERNGVSIDPRELPMDASLSTPAMTVTPAYRSGPVVRFPVTRSRAATLRLVLPDGTPVPAGASVTTRTEQVPVAMNGFVYLTSAAGKQEAAAEWRGQRCTFRFERPDDGDPQPDLGNVTCRPAAQDKVAAGSQT